MQAGKKKGPERLRDSFECRPRLLKFEQKIPGDEVERVGILTGLWMRLYRVELPLVPLF